MRRKESDGEVSEKKEEPFLGSKSWVSGRTLLYNLVRSIRECKKTREQLLIQDPSVPLTYAVC